MPTLDDVLRAIDCGTRREFDEAYAAAVQQFGAINNWSSTKDQFALGMIGLDRRPRRSRKRYYWGPTGAPRYRDSVTGVFAAIAQQCDEPGPWDEKLAADIKRYCEEYKVQAHQPPVLHASFFWPTRQRLIVFTQPGVVVNWLPEQMNPTPLFQQTMAAQTRSSARPWLTLVQSQASGTLPVSW